MASARSSKRRVVRAPAQGNGATAPAASPEDLASLRAKIDELDARVVSLINERAGYASHIGRLKAREGVKPYAPSREIQVYHRVAKLNKGPLPDDAFRAIYREIMSATIALEHPTRVCYFGQPGSFTHLAAHTKFGSSVEYTSARDARDVFTAVSRGKSDYGVVPIENSTEGGVNESIDLLAEHRLKIASEIYLPIHQHLLSLSRPREIKTIYSHPQGFAQTRQWVNGHLGNVARRPVGSTAEAAMLASKDKTAGAIAGELAAEIYKIPIQVPNIEDQPDNITRFFVIAEKMADRTGNDKTSLVISVSDRPGALLHLLQPFYKNGINLTRIESRPSKRRAWEYNFFIDMYGHVSDPEVKMTLDVIDKHVRHIEVLGSYPVAPRLPASGRRAGAKSR